MINNKFEEKTCGEGPSLSAMFEDDRHLQGLIIEIKVSEKVELMSTRLNLNDLHLGGLQF